VGDEPSIDSSDLSAAELAQLIEEGAGKVGDVYLNGELWHGDATPGGVPVLLPDDLPGHLEVLGEWSSTTPPSGAPVTWEMGETIGRIGSLYIYWNTGDSSYAIVPVGRFENELDGLRAAAAQAEYLAIEDGQVVSHAPVSDPEE